MLRNTNGYLVGCTGYLGNILGIRNATEGRRALVELTAVPDGELYNRLYTLRGKYTENLRNQKRSRKRCQEDAFEGTRTCGAWSVTLRVVGVTHLFRMRAHVYTIGAYLSSTFSSSEE